MIRFLFGGHQLTLVPRFLPGHRCTPGEAHALNLALIEAARSNKLVRMLRNGASSEALQAELSSYAEGYEFRAAGKNALDPAEERAWELAKQAAKAEGKEGDADAVADLFAGLLPQAREIVRVEHEAAQAALRDLIL